MHTINPRLFMKSDDAQPFVLDKRIDLAAGDAPVSATGKFIVFDHFVPPSQVLIVKAMAFYAGARINPGLASETFRLLDPRDANQFFAFEPQVNDQSPWVMDLDYNGPRLAAGPLSNNSNRQHAAGIGYISLEPWADIQRAWFNPMFFIEVKSQTRLRVNFSILPPSPTAPLPAGGQYGIGGAGGTRRVDYAGAIVAGMQMAEQTFARLMETVKNAPGV